MDDCWRFRRAAPIAKGGGTLVMGIVNLTPDSFATGDGAVPSPAAAVESALSMLADGADMIDFGAESTRPGAVAVAAGEEMRRLGEVVARVRAATDKPLSVDTYHAETAAFALEQGADMINDVTALRGGWGRADRHATAMARLAAREGAHVMLMHATFSPDAMADYRSDAPDIVAEVTGFLRERAELAVRQGVAAERIWFDPGFGFGKDFGQNAELLRRLAEVAAQGFPVAAGLSRKRMIGDALGLARGERLEASLALAVMASLAGAALVRVHDVKETVRAVGMADAVRGSAAFPSPTPEAAEKADIFLKMLAKIRSVPTMAPSHGENSSVG